MPIIKFKVSGNSMYPTLYDKQNVYCIKYFFIAPRKKDIIVFNIPNSSKFGIKRITKIHNNMYFVQGDNKNKSTDSNTFGYIEKKLIIGKVIW